MKTNDKGITLIKQFEGCKLMAYQDIVGIWTIGYGSIDNVTPGLRIDQAEADRRLMEKLRTFEAGLTKLVRISLTDNQFSALVSFCYNLGLHALEKSHLLIKLNENDLNGASNEFVKWNRAGGAVVAGLTRRREAERALFLTA